MSRSMQIRHGTLVRMVLFVAVIMRRCSRGLLQRLWGMIERLVLCCRATDRDRSATTSRCGRGVPAIETLEVRLALSTTIGGTITQGNLYGDQSVVLATPILQSGKPTQIQVIDTGDIGMGGQSVRTFTPFPKYSGSLNLAVGDFLHRGYQQLIVGTTSNRTPVVAVYDLFSTFANAGAVSPQGVFTAPVRLQTLMPFPRFNGAVSLAAADFDNDGRDDLAIGTAAGRASAVKIYAMTSHDDGGTLATPTLLNRFNAFAVGVQGGISLAAGHLTGNPRSELIAGAVVGGRSIVKVFRGADAVSKPRAAAAFSYQAFPKGTSGTGYASAIQVQLVESLVYPDDHAVTGLDQQGRTAMFTPANQTPLVKGTIVAYPAGRSTTGRVSLYSLASESAKQSTISLPNTSSSGKAAFRIHMTPVGYLFNHAIGDPLAPTVLVANPTASTVSVYSLSGAAPQPVKNIFPSGSGGGGSAEYDSSSFPFGTSLQGNLSAAVKLLKSDVATHVSGGTSGMLPSRQVAYQSPFSIQFQSDVEKLFARYGSGFFNDPKNQSSVAVSDWYASKTADDPTNPYGPDLAVFGQNTKFEAITSTDPTFWRESMVAAGLQFMNRGYSYQHHHLPAWFGAPKDDPAALGEILSTYDGYSLTPAGMQTPGLDCSDFSALVTNMVTGQKIKEGISEQATVVKGQTQWGTDLEGTSDIYINNDSSQGILSWYTLALYYQRHGAIETYKMLNTTLQTGDLLFYGTIPSGQLDPTQSLDIGKAAHVTIWTGQTLAIPGRSDVGVPLIMDSHGGNIQVGVDASNNPIGVVEPAGPQIRPWFVPNIGTTAATDTPLTELLPAATLADQNYYYFTNFTHAVRIAFPVKS